MLMIDELLLLDLLLGQKLLLLLNEDLFLHFRVKLDVPSTQQIQVELDVLGDGVGSVMLLWVIQVALSELGVLGQHPLHQIVDVVFEVDVVLRG